MKYDDLTIPRGAQYAAMLVEAIADGIHAVRDFFASSSPSTLEHATTREEVRRYAVSIQSTEPTFAAELLAACDKAELDEASV